MALLLILLLSACATVKGQCLLWCHNSTEVQNDYVIARNDCQDMAEEKLHLFSQNGQGNSAKSRNSMLLALFAKCMHSKDWGVTAPKKEKPPEEQANNNPPRPGTPWNPSPYGIQASPAQQGNMGSAPSVQSQFQTQSYPYQTSAQPTSYAAAPRPGTPWSPSPYAIQADPNRVAAPAYKATPSPSASGYPASASPAYSMPQAAAPASGGHNRYHNGAAAYVAVPAPRYAPVGPVAQGMAVPSMPSVRQLGTGGYANNGTYASQQPAYAPAPAGQANGYYGYSSTASQAQGYGAYPQQAQGYYGGYPQPLRAAPRTKLPVYRDPEDESMPFFELESPQDRSRAGVGLAPGF